jgi:phosphatidylglycerophosphatase A
MSAAAEATEAPLRTSPELGLPFWHPAVFIATGGWTGFLPGMPGTWASLAALPVAWGIRWVGNGRTWPLAAAALIAFLVGWWAAARVAKASGRSDPGIVVIDEIAAQWLVLCFVPLHIVSYLLAFLLFRLFDIVKPWPISWIDRRVKGGFGIMLDDVVAALCAILLLAG